MDYTEFDIKKRAMLTALEANLGVVTESARQAKITRATHYNWLKDDEKYRAAVEELEDVAIDFAEGKLHGLIKDGDTIATIFYLKTKAKKRGYIEKTIVESTNTQRVIMTDNDGEQINPEDTDL